MLNEIIDNLKRTVPDAFVNEPPTIPWIRNDSQIISLREISPNIRDFPLSPTIFVEPYTEISERDEELEGEIRERGIEALAWYVSFHQSSRWGIYFRTRGISYLSNLFRTKSNTNDVNERIKIAFDLLFYHEFFHFLTDIVSAHMEMVYKIALYNAYLKFLRSSAHQSLFIEEPLANAYVLRRTPKRYHSRIKNFFEIQPSPYTLFSDFASDIDFIKGKRKLGAVIHFHNISEIVAQALNSFPDTDEPFWEFVFNVEPEKMFLPQIPIYLVIEKHPNSSLLRFITPIIYGVQIAVYPCDHPPPHIHIWAPVDNKKDGRYLYPSLEPYLGAPSLSNKKKKKVKEIIKRHRDKIESIIKRQKP